MSEPTTNAPSMALAPEAGIRKPRLAELVPRFLQSEHFADPEIARRARLITYFGFLGFAFGILFATFYLSIGHFWGAGIVVVCSFGFGLTPFQVRAGRSLQIPGNLLAGIMTVGFFALCLVEGGVQGHAIAWFASVPLCALLLVGKNGARWWTFVCVLASAAIIGASLSGMHLPTTYAAKWHPLVTAAGYLALIGFLFSLGMIFETGRERAFEKMKEALMKLEASNEQLIHLNNEKTEFLGIAAHDLKNPLTAIIGSAQLISMVSDSAQKNRLAHTISAAGTRMRDLIADLLDANAIEQGKFTSNIERCAVTELVQESVEHNQPNASAKGITLRMISAGELWGRADRKAAVQILDNLISNAIKYSPHNTEVRIGAAAERGQILISVTDQGPGLSAEDQKKLFQKFTRLSAKPTGGESSTGLGLSIVKKLAQAMSGTVECRSELGAGATFIVRLPAGQ